MAEKIQSSDIKISIDSLKEEDSKELSSFSCGATKLDEFFHKEIMICSKYHYLSSYCARDISDGRIVAVFTLANDSVILNGPEDKEDFIRTSSSRINREYTDIFQKQSSFPAINIGHLGVRADMQSKGIGEQIIDFILKTFISYDISGCQFITVDSLNNPRTNKFYSTNGFEFQTCSDMYDSTRRMYITLTQYMEDDTL